jgi:hypothetical protein
MSAGWALNVLVFTCTTFLNSSGQHVCTFETSCISKNIIFIWVIPVYVLYSKENVKLSVNTHQFFIKKLFKLLHVLDFRSGHHQVTSTSLDQEITQLNHFWCERHLVLKWCDKADIQFITPVTTILDIMAKSLKHHSIYLMHDFRCASTYTQHSRTQIMTLDWRPTRLQLPCFYLTYLPFLGILYTDLCFILYYWISTLLHPVVTRSLPH